MSLIRPFAALRPLPEYTAAVIAPPYDVLNSEEARLRAQGKPYHFLHVSKPEIDLPIETEPYSEAVYAKGAENLQFLREQGILQVDPQPYYYLYGLTMQSHQQMGLVTVASVAAYDSGRIRKHELTRPDKEADRVLHIDVLSAQTGPVFLIYPHHAMIDELVMRLSAQKPAVEVTAEDGIIHRLWIIDQLTDIDTITATFEQIPYLYIADGHHRSAAASRVSALRRQAGGSDYFLSVIFPDNQVRILDYNRVIRDLNGLTVTEFLEKVAKNFTIETLSSAVKPQHPGEFSMFLDKRWYYLTFSAEKKPQDDPVAQLDVSLLAEYLIAPILNITDPRRDKRIDFVGGIRGLAELEKRVNSGEMAVAFALYPPTIAALMAVADAGRLMPPKSTWFEPKLADGLVSHLLAHDD